MPEADHNRNLVLGNRGLGPKYGTVIVPDQKKPPACCIDLGELVSSSGRSRNMIINADT
jgi:hypothetical protein